MKCPTPGYLTSARWQVVRRRRNAAARPGCVMYSPRRPEDAQDGGDSEDEDGTEDDASMGGNDGEVLGDAPAGTETRERCGMGGSRAKPKCNGF